MESEQLNLLIGLILVGFFTADRFNTPRTNRSSTTVFRYYFGMLLYLGFSFGMYLAIVFSPQIVFLLSHHHLEPLPSWISNLSRPLLAAIFLTVLLPKVPYLSHVDERIRKSLHGIASIPYEVQRMSAQIAHSRFAVPESQRETLKRELEEKGFHPKDLCFECDGNSLKDKWTKIASLMFSLENWEASPKYHECVNDDSNGYRSLKMQFHGPLLAKAKKAFNLLEEDLELQQNESVRGQNAIKEYIEDFTSQCKEFHQQIMYCISRALLQCEMTFKARNQRLHELGFRETGCAAARFTWNQRLFLFLLVWLCVLGSFFVWPALQRDRPSDVLFTKAIMISVIYLFAVLCAVASKERFRRAKRLNEGERPVAFYFLSGVFAAIGGLGISFAFNFLLHKELQGTLQHAAESWPWCIVSFSTAFALSFLMDNEWEAQSELVARLFEALSCAMVIGLSGCLAWWLLQSTSDNPPALAPVVSLATGIGALLGYLVPYWYRCAPRDMRQTAHHEESSAEAGLWVAQP